MIKKILLPVLLFAFVMVGAAVLVNPAHAQTSPFLAGCDSALGYSVTTGAPCSGTSTVIDEPMQGCTTALGYSITTGLPCSGSSVVLAYLAGCTSTAGYSIITGDPCNGTNVATPVVVTTPSFPTTGAGGNAPLYIALMSLSGIALASGVAYIIVHRRRLVK